MNYRHAFHAGNFADLVKHATLLQLLAYFRVRAGPLYLVDTHAGRGLYDLGGADAQRSGEAEFGIGRLMQSQTLPTRFEPLRQAVARLNPGGDLQFYPGSPLLIADQMRPGDRYLACELRADEHGVLAQTLSGRPGVEAVCRDGYVAAQSGLPAQGAALVLIDPPFERADEYLRIAETLGAVAERNREAVVMVWLPLKDLETFDGFLRLAEEAGAGVLTVVESRMRPLRDPMKMNGCALVLARAPAEIDPALREISDWIVHELGDGGQSRVWRTTGDGSC